ncbi:hypothetical protein HZC53_04985 [Candidatus Uhrbacteria bacterium]|nr:hypothetical protein [Candidatus Uhrbacteria bacterium]
MPQVNVAEMIRIRKERLASIMASGPVQELNRADMVGPVSEPVSESFQNRIVGTKPVVTSLARYKAYRSRQEHNYVIGPVETLSPYVKEHAEEALELTARFCHVLDRDVCQYVHQVPFSEADVRKFEHEARRAGYRGRSVLRYVPNEIGWEDLQRLPADIRLPHGEFQIPQLQTHAPMDDDLGVLNGCWYLHIPRALFLSQGWTCSEQELLLPYIARQFGAHPSLITMGDATDMVFLFALAVFNGEIENRDPEAVRTMTGAGTRAHACVIYSSKVVQLDWWEDSVKAPFLGLAPPLV